MRGNKEEDLEEVTMSDEEEEEEEAEICSLVALNLDNGVEVYHEFVNILKIGRRVGQKKIGDIEGLFDNRVMSRNHAVLHYREQRFFLEDTNSSNGTHVNDQRLQPYQLTEVFSGDVLEFGTEVQTTSSHIQPLRIQVKLIRPDGRQAGRREDEVTEISKKDLAELLAILSEADTDLNSLEKKLMALEEVVQQCKEIEIGGDASNNSGLIISKLANIEAGVENIRQGLDQRGLEDKRDLHDAFRQVLQELVTEGSGEVLTCLASKLRGEQVEEVRHVVGEEGEEYRLEPTGMLVIPKLKHSESAPNILYHQEADTETGSKNKGPPKGILRSPGTPRLTKTRSFFRMTSHPTEVWEIENCLAERDEEQWRQLEDESCMGRPVPRTASLETLVPSEEFRHQPRQRCGTGAGGLRRWTQIHDKKDHLNPTDLRMRLQQVSNSNKRQQKENQKIENEQQINEEDKQREEMLKKETNESILDPLNKKIDNIAERLEKDKNHAEANWEKSQRELEEVHGLVEEISRVLRRIFTGFVTSIQGFLFCFIFVVLLLAIGLRRSPNLLQIW